MKNKTNTGFKAITKSIFVMCAVLLAVSAYAQVDYTTAKDYHNKAARLWDKADAAENDSLRELYLKKAALYTDSAKMFYLKEHKRAAAEKSRMEKSKNENMIWFYTNKDSAIGKDTTNINWMIGELAKSLKKYQKPQPANGAEAKPSSTNNNFPAPQGNSETKPSSTQNSTTPNSTPSGNSSTAKNNAPNQSNPEDVIVKRKADATVSGSKSEATIPIEMIELHLKSSEPIKIEPVKQVEPFRSDSPKEKEGTIQQPIYIYKDGTTKTTEPSKVIVTDAPEKTENKSMITWEAGVDAGVTWSPNGGIISEPFFIHMTDASFGSESQWNEVFKGMTFPVDQDMKITTSPAWQFGLNAGCIINKNYEVKLNVGGGTFNSKAELPVRVTRMVPPASPSAPPATQQTIETITETALIGNFNSKLTGRIYFGKKIRGYAEAGGVVGLNHSSAVRISAAAYSETKSMKQTTVYGGGTVGVGVNIPLTNILSFETGVSTDLISVRQKFAAIIGMNVGLMFLF